MEFYDSCVRNKKVFPNQTYRIMKSIFKIIGFLALVSACNPNNEKPQKLLSNFISYYEAVKIKSPQKWDFTLDTLKIWMEDTLSTPRLQIKGKISSGPWKDWDSIMNSVTYYDTLWYNKSEHAIQGYFNENNDFYHLIGKPANKTLRTYWLNDQDKIDELLIYWIPEENKNTAHYLKPIVEWAMTYDSLEIKDLYPEGRIIPSIENAKRWKVLLKQYHQLK